MHPSRRNFLKYSGALTALATAAPLTGEQPLLASSGEPAASQSNALSDLVNVLQGTHSNPQFSRGNTLPIAAEPFGMAHWTLESRSGSPWFFHPDDQRIQGFRCTHQLSPWLSDYGWSTLLPVTGAPDARASSRASSYAVETLEAHPYGFAMDLLRYNIHAELTPTCRCAAMRFTSKLAEPISLVIDVPEAGAAFTWDADKSLLLWKTSANAGGAPAGFAAYYALRLHTSGARFEQKAVKGSLLGVLHLNATQGEVSLATSFLSHEQALLNLAWEIGTKSFDQVQVKAKSTWEEYLAAVVIQGGSDAQRRTFYSCLYRTLLFPRTWHEPDGSGKWVHFSPYSAKLTPGVMYADHGYWDVYRAWYPMMTLLFPERLGEILQAWVNAGAEGGWLPQFPCPGYRACMTGSLIDSVFGDAVAKDIPGFNREAAYRLLRKHATEKGAPEKGYGRRGVEEYLKLGYVPCDKVEQAAVESLDGHYGDFCIGQIASKLGHAEDAAMFEKRSKNWRLLFDPQTKFFRGKMSDGSWFEPFHEYQWGNPYVEGSAWQHRWAVPHEPEALMEMFGGRETFVKELQRCLEQTPRFEVGVYLKEIHEMSEMAAVPFGQYAHSNQPIHHMLYLFTTAGRPDLAQHWVRRVLNELYSPENFCGDEDTGAMAAWYVLSSLGLYTLCPGRPEWTLGAPLFRSATVRLSKGRTLTVEASGDPRRSRTSRQSRWTAGGLPGRRCRTQSCCPLDACGLRRERSQLRGVRNGNWA